jgi:glycosylphosphatidylinositol deacylase
VARKILTLDSYIPASISTIFTLATPHTRPPVSFNAELHELYRELNTKFTTDRDVVIISIAGGNADSLVPSDSTDISKIIPIENGVSVYSTGVEGVWASTDHKMILWCNQLVKVVSESIVWDLGDGKGRDIRLWRLQARFGNGFTAHVNLGKEGLLIV